MAATIKSIHIENFRSIKSVDADLTQLSIFVGRNDCGKSNILRSLNLFFNGETNPGVEFDFAEDYNFFAPVRVRKAKEVVVRVEIALPESYHGTNGQVIIWTKRWREDGLWSEEYDYHGQRITENKRGQEIREDVKIPEKSNVHALLRKIEFEYVPAIKDEDYFDDLRGRIYGIISEVATRTFQESSTAFEQSIGDHLNELTASISTSLGFATRLALPRDLSHIFERLDFLSGEKSVSLNNRGDGIKARHIPLIRSAVDSWRRLPETQWQVTAATARLLRHWRTHKFANQRPFFCQVEAVETVIWLSEVAPKSSSQGRRFWAHLEAANAASNPELQRLALKLATGAGKTTVMAMLIAWQTVNAVRHPNAKKFSRGFLIVAPGITIKDRLRVLQPNDPESYYRSREIVPEDMLSDLGRAKIVITNYHAFKKKEEVSLNKVQQAALRTTPKPESDGAMIRRMAGELMGLKNVVVMNDEAHHCYRERQLTAEEQAALKGDDLAEAKENNEAARLWISGLEAVKRELGVSLVYDLSATPFFLKGSGYREGSLFGWVMSDFSLMDAIECGIVKLPRVPIMDNVPGGDTPMFRNLWEHVGKHLPKKSGGAKGLDPQKLPNELLSAIDALYGHYEKTQKLWQDSGVGVDPVFIVVCNNIATSTLITKYVAGYEVTDEHGNTNLVAGKCPLFRNFDPDGAAMPRMRTLQIDSQQIDSGEAISADFRAAAGPEIARFKDELIQRTGDRQAAEKIDDATILREVMNTVGRKGTLGEGIRCVVSVSMLTEGWDANTVTHVLGVRAFGTQLLCEQVIGRALRRQSYQLQADGLFKVEYADVLGIPFDFTAQPVISKPSPPDNMERVHAVSPERDASEIRFPRVEGYRTELPTETLSATFTDDSTLELTPELVGATETINSGIVGESADLTLDHLADARAATIVLRLADWIVRRRLTDAGGVPKVALILQLRPIVRRWMAEHLTCTGGTQPAQLLYYNIADRVADRIMAAISRGQDGGGRVLALLDPYNREGSTRHVSFMTSKDRYDTGPRCHINYAVIDSDWEAEFCRVADAHPRVLAWVKNHNLGFEVPYNAGGEARRYRPDFIVRVDDGGEQPLNLVVEIKGARDEDDKDKAETMRTLWVPGVNNIGTLGRWGFAEFTDVWTIRTEFGAKIEAWFDSVTSENEVIA